MALETGTLVNVRLKGRLGRVLGLTNLAAYIAASDEPVYDVQLVDDGSVVQAGESSLGSPSELDPAQLATDIAAETPAEQGIEAAAAAEESAEPTPEAVPEEPGA